MKTKTILSSILFLFLLMFPSFAGEDIPPQRGDVTKNIHIILDYSGSMKAPDIQKQLEYFTQIAAQAYDDYSLAVTIFARNSFRMIPGDSCDRNEKLGQYWMNMPSERNIQAINAWIEEQSKLIDNNQTFAYPAIASALADDIEDLTIIVISDGLFDDKQNLHAIQGLQSNRTKGNAKIGIIDVNDCAHTVDNSLYTICRSMGWWFLNVGECKN